MNIIYLILITVLGLGLRVIGLNKTQGLWNDEYVSWMIASKPLGADFVHGILSQCHMPFYYLYLKFFMHFGGNGDLFLRATSVLAGVLSIIVMYFVGLQHSKKTALICALFTSISSFLIYYSQEVRIYSLLFLISALTLLYLLRFLKNKTWTTLGGLVLFNFLIIFTHTIGFVFVFFELVALTILLFNEYKKQLLTIWGGIIVLGGICLPQIIHIFTAKSFSQWWGTFSISKIGFLFTDYFSPVLTNLVNAPDNFLYVKSLSFVFFTIVPTLIALVFIARALYKNKKNIALFSICVGFVLIMTVAAILGKLVFITKYSIEIYPILLFLAAYGACSFENKKIANTFIACFCAISLTYLFISPTSAPKIPRPQGHKLVADLLNRAKPNQNDIIILEYYSKDRYEKYFDFSKFQIISIDKANFPEYFMSDKDVAEIFTNGKPLLKDIFAEKKSSYLDYVMRDSVLSKVQKGQNVIVIIPDSVAFYSKDDIKAITSDRYRYEHTPFLYLIFSYVRNRVFDDLQQGLAVTRYEKLGDWSLIQFTKLNK